MPKFSSTRLTPRKSRAGLIAIAVFVVFMLALPAILPNALLTFFSLAVLTGIVVTGVTLLMGYAGQVSLGQGAFFAISALCTAVAAAAGVAPILAFCLGPVSAGLFALIVGWPLTRLRGHYLAFGTLGLQLIVITIAMNSSWFGGAGGVQGIPQFSMGDFTIRSTQGYAYFAVVLLFLVLFVSYRVVHSRFGRAIRAMSASESAAEASGIPITRYRLTVFVLSAVFAGLAGALYPFLIGYVSASSFPLMTSFQYVAMAVVGGITSIWGGVVGVALIMVLTQSLSIIGTLPGMPATMPAILTYAVYAVVLIVFTMFVPKGVAPTLAELTKKAWWGSQRKASQLTTLKSKE